MSVPMMSSDHSTSQESVNSTTFSVSSIDVSLATDSHKTIRSIKLSTKNEASLRDVQKTLRAGHFHREEFDPPLVLEQDDHISVSVSCTSQFRKQPDVAIEINLRDVECMRDERDVRSYRKKARKVEVMVVGYRSFLATTTQLIRTCSQFRLLIIGNSGVGKSSLIQKMFGVEGVRVSGTAPGSANIDQEFISPTNERFIVHDSLGFEAGDGKNMDIVKQFIARRKAMLQIKDQLHAIWLCLEIPYSGGRLLEAGVERFLQCRHDVIGDIPLVVVLTKVDLLDLQMEVDLTGDETRKRYKAQHLEEHCFGPVRRAAGSDVTVVAVSVEDGYSESLSDLFKATNESMVKYHVDEAPRAMASIAQRVSIKEKLDLSIAVGKKKYWKMLLKSAVFRGRTLEECLKVIRKDIVTVWNFHDPDQCLTDDKLINSLLRTDNLGDASDASNAPSKVASFAALLAAGFELVKGLSGSGDMTLTMLGTAAGMAITVVRTTYDTYQEAKKDVKILMAYIVDLICVMQAIFLIAPDGRVTSETFTLALRAYERPRRFVHLLVDEFDGTLGVLPGGRDYVLERIEALIWRHSISDHEVEEFRQREG